MLSTIAGIAVAIVFLSPFAIFMVSIMLQIVPEIIDQIDLIKDKLNRRK